MGHRNNTTHDKSYSRDYSTWTDMKGRCLNKNHLSYSDYGGRGIKVCDRWTGENGFHNFYLDMGIRPEGNYSIERRNGNEDYSPENCYWATPKQQQMNLKTTNKLGLRGVTKYWGVFKARIRIGNTMKNLGSFKTPMEAHEAFVQAYYLKNKIWPPEYRDTPLCYKSPLIYKGLL